MRIGSPRCLSLLLASALAILPGAASANNAAPSPSVPIPYEQFELPNGLRVIVHTDRKAPIVATDLWYRVGSKNETPGRTGLAHLFEHLMFQNSEHRKGEYFTALDAVGATARNGTTSVDRTNYFQTVPTSALDYTLFMESDRMGHLLGAIDQKALDEQRGVVKNEKRLSDNRAYGRRIFTRVFEALYPAEHPYHWPVVGSMADLDAATLDDVKTWFSQWYGPNNAVLVFAGDIDAETARAKALRYFGDIPASATVPDLPTAIPVRTVDTRETVSDRVPQTRIYRAWATPEFGHADNAQLQLLGQILGNSASSRLKKRLMHEENLVDGVQASVWPRELSSPFVIVLDVKPGVAPERVEAIVARELRRLVDEGPNLMELEQARTALRAQFVRSIERVGPGVVGGGGKAEVLATCAMFTNRPDCYRDELAQLQQATPATVQAAGRRWLGVGSHTLRVQPGDTPASSLPEETRPKGPVPAAPPVDPKYRVVASDVDRSQPPVPEAFPTLQWPHLQRARLANGLQVVLAERHEVPLVQMKMEFPGGFASDHGGKRGAASLAMAMLDDGTHNSDALALAARQERLGAELAVNTHLDANPDAASVSLSALADKLDDSLALYAEVIRRPRFDEGDMERARSMRLAEIGQAKADPMRLSYRIMLPLLYGKPHPYGIPFSGTGETEEVHALQRADLVRWHAQFIRPDTATLAIVGDTTLREILPLLEKHFGDWSAPAAEPTQIAIPPVALPDKPRVFLIHQPGAVQSNIAIGQLVGPATAADAVEFDVANTVLGGAIDDGSRMAFGTRLNMNLREGKQWTYGAVTFTVNVLGQRPWLATTAVQTDKTAEAMLELQREIADLASGKAAITRSELDLIQSNERGNLPGMYETADAVLTTISDNLRYRRPDDYVNQRQARIQAMRPDDVQAAAAALKPQALTWVIVGDLDKIEAGVRGLNLGEVVVLDEDGRVVVGR